MWICGKKKKPEEKADVESLKDLRLKEAEIIRLQEQNQVLLQQKVTEGLTKEIDELRKFREEFVEFAKQMQSTLEMIRTDSMISPNKQNMLGEKEDELRRKLKKLEMMEKEAKVREESLKLAELDKKKKEEEERRNLELMMAPPGNSEANRKEAEENEVLKTNEMNNDLFQDTDLDEEQPETILVEEDKNKTLKQQELVNANNDHAEEQKEEPQNPFEGIESEEEDPFGEGGGDDNPEEAENLENNNVNNNNNNNKSNLQASGAKGEGENAEANQKSDSKLNEGSKLKGKPKWWEKE